MKTKREFNIPQYCSLLYPFDKYTYIKINFIIIINNNMKHLFPIIDSKIKECENIGDIKSCYFIFCPLNWYNKHDVRVDSDHSSKEWSLTSVNNEFSYDLYKKNIVDKLLLAAIDDNNNLIEFETNQEKEKIHFNIIDCAVEQLIKQTITKRPYQVNLDELSKKSFLYNRFHLLRNSGKHAGGILPKPPAAMILKNLSERYPSRAPEDLMDMDDLILEMFEVLDNQETIKRHETNTVNENVAFTNAQRQNNNKNKLSNQERKPVDRKQLNKKLLSKLEDVGQFRKK